MPDGYHAAFVAQEFQRLQRPAGAVALAVRVDAVQVIGLPAFRPVRAQRHKSAVGDAPVALLPRLDVVHGDGQVMELLGLFVQVKHREWQNHLVDWQLVEGAGAIDKVDRRVHVRAPLPNNFVSIHREALLVHGEQASRHLVLKHAELRLSREKCVGEIHIAEVCAQVGGDVPKLVIRHNNP